MRDYDSTVARVAGNIIGHIILQDVPSAQSPSEAQGLIVAKSVELARHIVAEVCRTEPVKVMTAEHRGYCALHPNNRRAARIRLGRALVKYDCGCVRPGVCSDPEELGHNV